MSAGKAIDLYNKKENQEKCMNEFQEFKKMLRDFECLLDNYYDDYIYNKQHNKNCKCNTESDETEPCNHCACSDIKAIKESFHTDLDNLRNKFLRKYDSDLNGDEMNWIYKFTEYLKNNKLS